MLNQDDSATSQWQVWTFRRKISSYWVNFCPVWREIDTLRHIMWEETFIWCHMNGKYNVDLRYLSFIFAALQATVNSPNRQRPTSRRRCRAADLTFKAAPHWAWHASCGFARWRYFNTFRRVDGQTACCKSRWLAHWIRKCVNISILLFIFEEIHAERKTRN